MLITWLLLFATLFPQAPISVASARANIQPQLLQLAKEEPDLPVSVIVQQSQSGKNIAEDVVSLGGTITNDLRIIHAVAVKISAGQLPALAALSSVAWISLDTPVSKSAAQDAVVVRSDFGRKVGAESSDWLRNGKVTGQKWIEVGESDGPNLGDIATVQFLGGMYDGVRLQGSQKGLGTSLDLRRALDASFSFGYRRKNFSSQADCVSVFVSIKGAGAWNELQALCGPTTDADLQNATVDLNNFIGYEVELKFVTSAVIDSAARFYLNYAQLAWTPQAEIDEEEAAFHTFLPLLTGANGGQPTEASDADLVKPAETDTLFYVLDEFSSLNWSGNSGLESWATSWVEVDPETMVGGAGSGAVRITGGALRMDDSPDTGGEPSAARKVNLKTNIASAQLSFNYWTSSKVGTDDVAVVEVSTDGGVTYSVLETFIGNVATPQSRLYDLSSYLPCELYVRFRLVSNFSNSSEFFYVDDVRIDYDKVSSGSGWVALVPDASQWLYSTESSKVDSTWKDIHFDDSKWKLGQAELGYGDGDETTTIKASNSGNDTTTAYFRRRFIASDATTFSGLTLSILKDDGIVIYLNNSEIYRGNMPSGTITASTAALVAIEGADETRWTHVDVPATALVNGENILAVEVHQAVTTTTDLSFDMEFGGYTSCVDCINTGTLATSAVKIIKADQLWNTTKRLQGQSIGVAVVDSGIARNPDMNGLLQSNRVVASVNLVGNSGSIDDAYGHGTHVAGTIAGNGASSGGAYTGVAPKANLIDVRVTDDTGQGSTSNVVAGLQWIYENRAKYNIRVVNLSLNSSVAESYLTSPLDAALEVLWFNRIVVVVSAGNNGGTQSGVLFPPANDPFVITVGATDDKGTLTLADDEIAGFSAFGVTAQGFSKPDIVAPGRNIVSLLASDDCNISLNHPGNIVQSANGFHYLRISGTSMSSAVVAGAAALLVQDRPDLTPDQIKYRLMATANKDWSHYTSAQAGAGYLDILAAINGTTSQSANTNIVASNLLWTGSTPAVWGSVNWNSVNWNSVNWNSVNWNSVNWNSLNWTSVSWE
ncbi:MAG: S8 family peptidase [Caldilineaceae bacterium]